jgi:hypothetical protein
MAPTLSRDTSADAEAVQLEILRQMPVWRKVQSVVDQNRTGRLLALSGLRSRYSSASPEEVHRRLMSLLLGEPTAMKVFGPVDDGPP